MNPFGKNLAECLEKIGADKNSFLPSSVRKKLGSQYIGTIPDEFFVEAADQRQLPKYDRISKITACVIGDILESGGLVADIEKREGTGIISGSGFGCTGSYTDFVKDMIDDHNGVDPMKFPFISHNYPISIGSIQYGLKGPIAADISSMSSSLNALIFGHNLVANGFVERMIVIGFEELTEIIVNYLETHGYLNGKGNEAQTESILCEGCAGVLIESVESAKERGQEVLGEIQGYAVDCGDDDDDRPRRIEKNLEKILRTHGEPDLLLLNASGAQVEDKDEQKAIANLTQGGLLTNSCIGLKKTIGHYLGASGLMEIIFGLSLESRASRSERSILINSFGMGSNLISFAIGTSSRQGLQQ